tara:strand:+ start:224 stop:631 length:408 start_codon:yes stop_codon:yes gene_type:complete
MNSNYHLDTAYIAGLFDGEGSLTYKKYKEKKKSGTYNCRRISMEISMTDQNVIELVHETLMVGTVRPKKVPKNMKPQWRWRCTFRDCLHVCKMLWPHVIVKLHAIEKVIDHYEPDIQDLGDNLIDLEMERGKRNV